LVVTTEVDTIGRVLADSKPLWLATGQEYNVSYLSIHPSILHVAMVGTGSLWPVHYVCFLSSMLMPMLVGYIALIYQSCKGKSKFQIAHELGKGIYVSIKTSSWIKVRVYRFCKIINPIKGKSK
jgi:hypothetical protein